MWIRNSNKPHSSKNDVIVKTMVAVIIVMTKKMIHKMIIMIISISKIIYIHDINGVKVMIMSDNNDDDYIHCFLFQVHYYLHIRFICRLSNIYTHHPTNRAH